MLATLAEARVPDSVRCETVTHIMNMEQRGFLRTTLRVPPHMLDAGAVLQAMGSSAHGLTEQDVRERLRQHGPNALPRGRPSTAIQIFLHQYGNVRKVIFLLISTGAAEIVLFVLALASNVPLPLVAVQLLWLNLVTNGIQDVALAFEPAEGGELARPPRPPRERVFNGLMIERVALSAVVIGGLAFGAYQWMLGRGYAVEEARNGTLLLMVLFENVQAFNSRSETLSVFRHNPLRNKLLFFGTLAAQAAHIGAMYTLGLREVLGVQPVSLAHWSELLALALAMLLAMEAHKRLRCRSSGRSVS